MNTATIFTIAETATRIGIPEATVRRYLGYFGLDSSKEGRKVLINEATVQMITEIAKLKENGMSLAQIKDLRDKSTADISTPAPVTTTENDNITSESNESTPPKRIITKTLSKSKTPIIIKKPADILKEKQEQQDKLTEETEKNTDISTIEQIESPNLSAESNPEDNYTEDMPIDHSQGQEDETTNSHNRNNRPQHKDSSKNDKNRLLMTKDSIGQEITNQSRKVSKLNRLLGTIRNKSPKEYTEVQDDLNRRYNFLAGLRYLRDNWVTK